MKPIKKSCPPEFICHITQQPMMDPVTLSSGNNYERLALIIWLKRNDTDPQNFSYKLVDKEFKDNPSLKKRIESWQLKNNPAHSFFRACKPPSAVQQKALDSWVGSLRK